MTDTHRGQTLTLPIKGMHCASCVNRVERALSLSPLTYFIAMMVAGLGGGLVVYYLIERPIMRVVRRMRRARRSPAAAPAKANC